MSSLQKLPLLTRIALSADWDAGYAVLLSEGGWPPEARAAADRFVGRLQTPTVRWAVLREATSLLTAAGLRELAAGAELLMADPRNATECAVIATMLADEREFTGIKDMAVDRAVAGWTILAEGLWVTDEQDPIKAARIAFEARGPAADEAPEKNVVVLDDWELMQHGPDRFVRGTVSAGCKFKAGSRISTSAIKSFERERIETQNSTYLLGSHKHELPLICRTALQPSLPAAVALVLEQTGERTLPPDLLAAYRSYASASGEGRRTAGAIAARLCDAGRDPVAAAWWMLSAEGDDELACSAVHALLKEAVGRMISGVTDELESVVRGWCELGAGRDRGLDVSDPVTAARMIGAEIKPYVDPAEKLSSGSDDVDALEAGIDLRISDTTPGVVVLRRVGGTQESQTARDCIREFKDIAGKRLPLAPVPDIAHVRAVLRDEFPHATAQVDVLLSGLVEGQPIRMRPVLLVSTPGCGKSRLAVRLAEKLMLGLRRFDGAGSSDNAFGGTPRRWSTGEYCQPLDAVRQHKIANPMMLVDEIDKCGSSRHNGNLENALMPFIEQETARAYPDPYVQSECDLSHVNYVLTANSDTVLSGPLRDRLRIVRLPEPSIEHLPALARSLVNNIAAASGADPRWFAYLDDGELAVAEVLWRGGSVRRLRHIVERILARREECPRN